MLTNQELRIKTTSFFGSYPDIIDLYRLRQISKYLKREDKFDVGTRTFKKNILVKLYYNLNIEKEKGCWYRKDWSSYTGIYVPGRKIISGHRLSYETFFGKITEGMSICHHCDRPGCINPFHLFQGTHVDNLNDMAAKGRSPMPVNSKRLIQVISIMQNDRKRLKIW